MPAPPDCRIPPASASPHPARWTPGAASCWRHRIWPAGRTCRWSSASRRRLGLPAFLERDTNVAVMAEWRHGAAREARDVIYITVSTGIGGGIVVDGRPLIGPDGTAGEVGHVTVELDGPLCGDGSPGHAEAIGSGTAIAREGRALLEAGRSPKLAAHLRRLGRRRELGAEHVARSRRRG